MLYKKLVEIQKLNWSKSAKNIAQNAGFCIKIIKIFMEANPLPSSSDHLHGPRDKDYQNFGRSSSILRLLALWTIILKKLVSNPANLLMKYCKSKKNNDFFKIVQSNCHSDMQSNEKACKVLMNSSFKMNKELCISNIIATIWETSYGNK